MEDQIPAGAEVPAEETGETTTTEEPSQDQQPDVAALQQQIANLEKLVGRQGEELGTYRKQVQAQPQEPEEDKPSFDDLEAEIMDKLDEGELDVNEAMRQIAKLASERGAETAISRMTQQQQEERLSAAVQQFMKEHSDFEQLKESGALQREIEANPIHDEFSAYYALKAKQAEEAGKQKGMEIASESNNAQKVIGKSGDTPPAPTQTLNTRSEVKQAMAERLRAVRANGG